MTETKTCPKCESSKIVPRAHVLDRGEKNLPRHLQVAVERKPEAWLFRGAVTSNVYATICGACGYTEFYVEDPADVYSAYVESQARRR
jgi:predicted nucleic-acid-binding Zn-ribbon protein